MAIPNFETIMLPFLQYINDGNEHTLSEAEDHLSKLFQLTDQEKNELLPSGKQRIFLNRISWARTYLKKAGFLASSKRGYFTITKQGLEILKQNLEKLDAKFLSQYFDSSIKNEESTDVVESEIDTQTPNELIETGFRKTQSSLEEELLVTIKEKSPQFFENLIKELVEKIFKGSGKVTGKTGDGGIDGIISVDELGLDPIYLQAKRWQGNVPEKEIRDFAGALQRHKSKKGVFITTSDFTNDAKSFTKDIDSKIILINGKQLVKYMIKYDIGVKPVNTYQIKKIDNDYFLNEE